MVVKRKDLNPWVRLVIKKKKNDQLKKWANNKNNKHLYDYKITRNEVTNRLKRKLKESTCIKK